ncbi:MAG TPA: ABC transporter permease [Ktedonobacteraceae bacterium]|nr:ABC transporter permease [Ktedonobacteraceae bacterium]
MYDYNLEQEGERYSMVQFLIRRFIGLVFVIVGVTFITFILGYLSQATGTGDPIRNLLGEHFNPTLYAQLKHSYGLDLPWYQQYFNYLTGLLRGDFGTSYHFQGRAVWDILRQGVPVSAELGFWALLLTLLIGIPIGIVSALRANSWVDTVNMTVALSLYALPTFVTAVFFQVIIVQLHVHTCSNANLPCINWPVSNWGVPWQYTWNDIQFKLAPIIVYAATGFAYFTRLTRNSMLEVIRQDYVRTARAKGLRERTVIYTHAFRNAMIPLITVIGLAVGLLVTGVFFVEDIFNIPGIGQTSLIAIGDRDYPVIQATTILLAVAVVVGNLLSDILYTVVDPRIKST